MTAKKIGDSVKVKNAWYQDVGRKAMTRGIEYKFQQHKVLHSLLVKCKRFNFVECNVNDKFWGNGLWLHHQDNVNPALWKGQNVLGICLNEVAAKL